MNSPYEVAQHIERNCVVYATSDKVVLARGDDALTWLNGQVTADVRTLEPQRGYYALCTTVKGRVVSDLWISSAAEMREQMGDGGVRLVLPERGFASALERFEAHIIMEDVELTTLSEQRVITVQGPGAAALRPLVGDLPSYEAARFGTTGFDVVCPADRYETLLATLLTHAAQQGGLAADDAGWAGAHVLLACPRFGVDFGPDNYPQEAGLKDRALSFQKGCYQGQEVIYMLENRGQLARRLVQLEVSPGAVLAPHQRIDDASGNKTGEITSTVAARQPDQPSYALGYVKRVLAEPGHPVSIDGASARVRAVIGLTETRCPIVAG